MPAATNNATTRPPASRALGDEPASGSADRTLRLLSALAEEGRALSMTELATRLDLPEGTVHRLCASLLATGFLMRDVDERMLGPGPALRRLALGTLSHGSLRGLRHEVLAALAQEIGETCNFTTLGGAEVIYLDRVEAQWPVRLTIDVGAHIPLHCTSSGKLLLAYMPEQRRDLVIQRLALPRMTPSTITSREQLRTECDEIVKCGFARDREEFVPGLTSVAVPVCDREGAVRATVSVHAPTPRLSMAKAEGWLGTLRAAASEMAKLL